jgi:hypothetical protein
MATGFQRYKQRRPSRVSTCRLESGDLGVWPAEAGVPTLAHHRSLANDDCAY